MIVIGRCSVRSTTLFSRKRLAFDVVIQNKKKIIKSHCRTIESVVRVKNSVRVLSYLGSTRSDQSRLSSTRGVSHEGSRNNHFSSEALHKCDDIFQILSIDSFVCNYYSSNTKISRITVSIFRMTVATYKQYNQISIARYVFIPSCSSFCSEIF